MLMSKKLLKRLKREIVCDGSLSVGYYNSIVQHLPDYALIEAIGEMVDNGGISIVDNSTRDITIRSLLVTLSIKHCNYQDFKDLAPYFFNYKKY